jgi:anthranilate synthase component 2
MRILLLDNYDPQIDDLARHLRECGAEVVVYRNDMIEVEQVRELNPSKIVLSPGPDTPNDAGISLPLIRELSIELPILGIGLGHQTIAAAFGGRVQAAPHVLHHTALRIEHSGKGIFTGLASPFTATNNSELLVEQSKLPDALEVTAWNADRLIMGLRHRSLPVEGIQFDPSLDATGESLHLLRTFLLNQQAA